MNGTLTFNRVVDGPDHLHGLYVDVLPSTARPVRELWGGWKITRNWTNLKANAAATLELINSAGSAPQQTNCRTYQEGAYMFMGRDMILIGNVYDDGFADGPALLSIEQCKQLLADWTTLLGTRPHKSETLPEPISFSYLADGETAKATFFSSFTDRG